MKIQPADSGVQAKVIAELQIPDPKKSKAMEIINGNNQRADADDSGSDQPDQS